MNELKDHHYSNKEVDTSDADADTNVDADAGEVVINGINLSTPTYLCCHLDLSTPTNAVF